MEHRTTSLPGAAFAMARGAKLLRCELKAGDHRECRFVLDDPRGIVGTDIADYYAGDEMPASAFYSSLVELRRMVNRTLNGGAL